MTLKIAVTATLVAVSLSLGALAQAPAKNDTKNAKSAPQLKEHQCNPKCNAAAHNYVHGEKGHKCTAECKKTTGATTQKKA
jgi:hypothetical protein